MKYPFEYYQVLLGNGGVFRHLLLVAAFALASTASGAAAEGLTIRVVDYDRPDRRVLSEVILTRMTGETVELLYDPVDDPAVFSVSCSSSDRVKALPRSSMYFTSPPRTCVSPLEIKVMSSITFTAIRNEAYEEKIQNPARAALLYNEIYARSQYLGFPETELYRIEALEAAALAFGIEEGVVLDPLQNRFVASDALVGDVRDLQRNAGFPPTGTLDARTFQLLSRTSIGPVLRTAPE